MATMLFVFFTILYLKGEAADVVETETNIFSSGSLQERVQGIPRESIIPMDDTGMVVLYESWYVSEFNEHLWKYSDYMQTLDDSISIDANSGNHAHIAYRNDTMWLAANPISADSILIYLIDLDAMMILDTGTLDTTGFNNIVASLEHTTGSNMVLVAREGTDQSINGVYATSSDNGLTWAWAGDYFAYNHDMRFDLDPWGDSVINIVFDRGGATKPYVYFLWDGSSWSTADTIMEESGALKFERLYSTVVGLNGTIHVAWSDTSNPSHVIHAYKDTGAGWVIDTPHTATQQIQATGGIWTAMTYSAYGAITRLFFTTSNTGGNDNDQNLYVKKWSYGNDNWGTDSLEVTTDTTCRNLSGCLNVPSSHGDRAYLHYICHDGSSWKNRFVVITDSTTIRYTNVKKVIGKAILGGSIW